VWQAQAEGISARLNAAVWKEVYVAIRCSYLVTRSAYTMRVNSCIASESSYEPDVGRQRDLGDMGCWMRQGSQGSL
jgi:hypothetical protein